MMKSVERLLQNNKAWAAERLQVEPDYFNKLASLQTPEFLWIGCSDSRVPANQITGTEPGEIFVHRNIANLVVHTDLNQTTVLEYALRILKVRHVIVCGHYGCGGIRAAMSHQDFGVINQWLLHIKDVIRFNEAALNKIANEDERADRLVELNVEAQVRNLVATSVVQEFWKKEQRPYLHGWVYGLKDGILRSILHIEPGQFNDPIFQYDIG
jgi:carbonic anhydrase